tara:strand:+ start:101 stop:301 length:201 start_codon:yes stop_codon:yes gene_type:complete
MEIRLIPPKMDAFDKDDIAVFTMEMADESCASIEIRAWIDRNNWPHIQKAVSDALEMMFPESDDAP